MRQRLIAALLTVSLVPLGVLSECRLLTGNILYEYDSSHRPYLDTVVVLSVSRSGSERSILMSVPKQVGKEWQTQFLRSRDNGKHWSLLRKEEPSPLAVGGMPLAVAPSDPQLWYRLSSTTDSYLRSADGGRTWSRPADKLDGLSPDAFLDKIAGQKSGWNVAFSLAAVHPLKPLTIFATVRVFQKVDSAGGMAPPIDEGLYSSQDGGDHWAKVASDIVYQSPLGIDPLDENVFFAQSHSGIVKSTDGGRTWSPVGQAAYLSRLPPIKDEKTNAAMSAGPAVSLKVIQFAFDPEKSEHVYAVTNKGIYVSSDSGNNWCLLRCGRDVIGSWYSLAIDPIEAAMLYVGTRFGLMYSDNGGESFKRIYP